MFKNLYCERTLRGLMITQRYDSIKLDFMGLKDNKASLITYHRLFSERKRNETQKKVIFISTYLTHHMLNMLCFSRNSWQHWHTLERMQMAFCWKGSKPRGSYWESLVLNYILGHTRVFTFDLSQKTEKRYYDFIN